MLGIGKGRIFCIALFSRTRQTQFVVCPIMPRLSGATDLALATRFPTVRALHSASATDTLKPSMGGIIGRLCIATELALTPFPVVRAFHSALRADTSLPNVSRITSSPSSAANLALAFPPLVLVFDSAFLTEAVTPRM